MTEAKTNPTMKDRVAFDSDSSVSTKENHIKHYDNSNIANRNSTDRKKDGSNDNNDGNCNDRNKDNPNHGEGNDNSNDVNNISSNSDIEEVREIVKIVAAPYPPPSSRLSFFKKRKDNEEEKRLDQFLIRYSTVYSFAADCFHKLVRELLQNRLLNPEWNEKATREHKLRVLRAVRVLTRDSRLQHILTASMPALTYLATELEKLKNDYYSDADYPYISECLVEFTSILKRLTAVDALRPKLFELSIHKTLVTLLSARDVNVLQAALIAMINLAQEPLLVQEGQGGDATEALNVSSSLLEATLHLFQQGQSHASCQFLAAELLDILVEYKSCRREIQLLSGNSIFLSFLHASTEENLLLVVLRCLANMAIDPNASREIRHLGGIPLILSLIR